MDIKETIVQNKDKKSLLAQLLSQDPSVYPLSHGQEALWFLQKQAPSNYAYNVAACIEIKAAVDPVKFRSAFTKVIQRHPSLRCTFYSKDGKLKQKATKNLEVPWQKKDLRNLTRQEQDKIIHVDYQQPFDLTQGLPCRAFLYQCDNHRWVFSYIVHHIAIDGWSLWQVLTELQHYYHQPHKPLPEITPYHRDFVLQQRLFLSSSKAKNQLRYWKQQLTENLPILQLPTERIRPPQQTFNGKTYSHHFSKIFSAHYKSFCRKHRVTPFVMGMTVYAILLHRLTHQNDFIIATPVSGRNNNQFMDVVGYFVNPLPIRIVFSENEHFLNLLEKVKQQTHDAQENQDIPFPVLVDKLAIRRDASYPILAQAMFVYQKILTDDNTIGFDDRDYTWGQLLAKHYPLDQQAGQFDLALEILEGDQALTAHWKYNSDLIAHEYIATFAKAFEQLALNIIHSSKKTYISDIPLVNAQQTQTLMPQPIEQHTVNECLHERFSRIASEYPTNIAVSLNKDTITYHDLEKRSNQLSQYLISKGVNSGDKIGISLDRSIDLIIAIIGILKANACYIPMDPTYPSDRIQFMAKDAGVEWIISSDNAKDNLARNNEKVILINKVKNKTNDPCSDINRSEINRSDINRRETTCNTIKSSTDQLAYVLYTSGSTGRPKGVKVSHANVIRLFDTSTSIFQFSEKDTWTLFHSYAFDFSVWELWGALLFGGKLVIVPHETSRSPQDFRQLLADENITILNQTPSAFQQLVSIEKTQKPLTYLRWIIFGGEALDTQMLSPWFERYGDENPKLVNMYGITETTVHVTYRILSKADLTPGQSMIGKPLPDLHLTLLDCNQQPVPMGFPGEIFVGGPGVSQGYLNRPELSATRFLDNPIIKGTKIYRTGDMGLQTSSGDIAYLGRLDSQIQLRGFRIELSEIESQLSSHPKITSATVILREDTPGDARIIAYYILNDKCSIDWQELRNYLEDQLPLHMIPATGVALMQLPLTSNGKIDRGALPPPDYSVSSSNNTARDSLEQRLSTYWAEILKVPSVGITDNFFELGGHSLLAVQLAEKIKRDIDNSISVGTLLRCPTVEKLAKTIRQQGGIPWCPLIPLHTQGDLTPVFCVPGGGGNALYYLPFATAVNKKEPHRPFYGLQAKGLEGSTAPANSVTEIAAENIAHLKKQQPSGPYILAGHCFGGIVAYEMAQQLLQEGHSIARLIIMDVPAPIPKHQPPGIAWSNTEWLRYLITVIEESTGIKADFSKDDTKNIDFEDQLLLCKKYMEKAGIIPQSQNNQAVTGLLNVFRNHSQLAYQPKQHSPLPITLFRALDFHPSYDYSATDDSEDIYLSSMGWLQAADTSFKTVCVPGTHISMMLEPHVNTLANLFHKSLIEQNL